ncbi:MAG: hydroxyacid dehydrogenase, partial [Ottowia sp.]|nr:hydroxyacid dehydrogenase [Ottowia sp.]
VTSVRSASDARADIEAILVGAFEKGIAADAVLSQSHAQEELFWHLREAMSHAQRPQGGSIKHDISVPVAAIPDFIERAAPIVESVVPGARVVCFGHMGDGNLHYNVSQPVGASKLAFLDKWEELNEAVHALVLEMNGSISAEHGIGQLKRRELARTAPPEALELMRRIKHAFDPAGIMNPGKVI